MQIQFWIFQSSCHYLWNAVAPRDFQHRAKQVVLQLSRLPGSQASKKIKKNIAIKHVLCSHMGSWVQIYGFMFRTFSCFAAPLPPSFLCGSFPTQVVAKAGDLSKAQGTKGPCDSRETGLLSTFQLGKTQVLSLEKMSLLRPRTVRYESLPYSESANMALCNMAESRTS